MENMTAQRMRLLLWAFLGTVLFICTTLALGQEVKRIDDKALKTAGKGTEWTVNGMDWGEQRYSTMTQINPGNVSKLAPRGRMNSVPAGATSRRLRCIRTASYIP